MWELQFGEPQGGRELRPLDPRRRREGAATRKGSRSATCASATWRPRCGASRDVYNEAWGDNWGFVPITDAEVEFQAKNLKQVIDEDWAFMAEKDGEVGRRGAHPARHQPGDGEAERAPAALRLAAVPARQAQDRPAAGLRARRQARLPPHRRRRRPLPQAPRGRRPGRARSKAARWAGSWRPTSR